MLEDAAPDPITAALTQVAAPTWTALWAAVDAFAAEVTHTTWSMAAGEFPYPVYTPATAALWGRLQSLIAIEPFDWKQWGGLDRYQAGTGLAAAPVAEAMRLVTALTRAERFGEGTIGNATDNGTLAAIVDRLRRWHDERADATPCDGLRP